ncbi:MULTISPECIES: hypothetical protein [Dermabacter]|nr:hypothetical protein [Dermabacter jinjuensis]
MAGELMEGRHHNDETLAVLDELEDPSTELHFTAIEHGCSLS